MCSDRKMTLAVTGGIGSGKSLVCSMFAARGIPVYDSDLRTRALYDSSPGLLARISSALGTDVSGPDGKADRRKIASAVFPDPSRLALLEAVVHPEVRRDFSLWKAEFDGAGVPFVIIESAIILEKPFFRDVFDKVLVVDAPAELRLKRAMARDKATEEMIRARMAGQGFSDGAEGERIRMSADYLIENDGDIAELSRKVGEIYDDIIRKTND